MNQSRGKSAVGPRIIAVLVIVLIILHQDYWFWDNDTLVLGIMPLALFYHICISIAASGVWVLATKIAWPEETIARIEHGNRAGTAVSKSDSVSESAGGAD